MNGAFGEVSGSKKQLQRKMLLDTPASMKKLDLQPNLQLGNSITTSAVLLWGEEHNLTVLTELVSLWWNFNPCINKVVDPT